MEKTDYETIRTKAEEYYRKIGKIQSPIFNEGVSFNSEGFNHLIYKRGRKEREKNRRRQNFNFCLLPKL